MRDYYTKVKRCFEDHPGEELLGRDNVLNGWAIQYIPGNPNKPWVILRRKKENISTATNSLSSRLLQDNEDTRRKAIESAKTAGTDPRPAGAGWKFHVCVSEHTEENIKKTWNIVLSKIEEHDLI